MARLRRGAVRPCDPVRVWRRADDLAGRVAVWVRWATWLLSLGRAGELPWVWEDRRPHHPVVPPPVPGGFGSTVHARPPIAPPNLEVRY